MSTSFKEILQKAVNGEVKTGLKSSAIVWDLDVCYLKDHCLSYNTSSKVQTKGFKDFSQSEDPKLKNLKFAPPRDNMAKPAKKENKKKSPKSTSENALERKKNRPWPLVLISKP